MKNILSYLMLLFLIVSCKEKKIKLNTVVNYKVVSKSVLLKGWKTYNYNDVKINIPSNWKPNDIKDALLYTSLNKDGNDFYYVILNYNTSQINSINYLKEIFKEVSTKDLKFKYSLKKIAFKNTNKCYYLELFTNENNVKYKIYSLIYEEGNQIYDFSYKTLDDKKMNAQNYQTFFTILFSFEYKYDNIIDSEKFIIDDAKILKYEDL
ncbi:putative lipoprotein [Flavobacterium branchiophilum]|uniref:Probable lipoprotein n=1 Tax=Flavobacterium branchiophilum (strain FL-15) TaxID=1034807 RepID=G2Z279_FLABF|nr:hypothetical protein [Flavobacterium branchiophilum]CCB70034.1 Probable lipoprotein precursor [Flavobacterium branchiophilum FL-15]